MITFMLFFPLVINVIVLWIKHKIKFPLCFYKFLGILFAKIVSHLKGLWEFVFLELSLRMDMHSHSG